MPEIVFLMLAGTAAGFLMRRRLPLLRFLEKGILWSIYLLLFLLGLSIGSNPEIVRQLPGLGGQALLLSLGAVGGSLLFAFFAWRFMLKKKKGES